MKLFVTPEMNISIFESENVVTTSGSTPTSTAVDQAQVDAANIAGTSETVVVNLWEQ